MQRIPHLLGLGLDGLSHSQLDTLEEMHTALLRSITESRIKLVQQRERMMVEEAAAREHTKLQVAEQQQAAMARNSKDQGDGKPVEYNERKPGLEAERRQESINSVGGDVGAGHRGKNGAAAANVVCTNADNESRGSSSKGRGRARTRGATRAKR